MSIASGDTDCGLLVGNPEAIRMSEKPAKHTLDPHCRLLMSFNGMTAHFGKNPYERKTASCVNGKPSASNRCGTRWPLGPLF